MGFKYHLASSGDGVGNVAHYVRIGGTAAIPVIETEVVIRSGDANSGMYSIFSSDGGLTLWASGDPWQPDPLIGHGLDYSSDGGATWINRYLDLPEGLTDPGREWYASIHGWQDDLRAIASKIHDFGTDDLDRYNDVTTKWAHELGLAGTNRPHSIWAVANTDIAYATAATVWQNLWRTTNRGDTWVNDPTFLVGIPGWPFHVVAKDDGTIFVLLRGPAGGIQCRKGVWGGPWSDEVIDATGTINIGVDGRKLGIDETGAVWAYLNSGKVFRRDYGTGIWSLVLTTPVGGTAGSIWVTDSETIIVTSIGHIYLWNGSSWTDHTIVDLGLVDNTYLAIWGNRTDANPPVITLIDPQIDNVVAKQGSLTFKAVDVIGDVVSLIATVNGKLIYSLPSGCLANGWYASTIRRIDGIEGKGYQVSLTPDRFTTWRRGESIKLSVTAVDNNSNSDSKTWDFVSVPSIVPPIFNYITEAIRNEDNKG
jgi:hypothetical protein